MADKSPIDLNYADAEALTSDPRYEPQLRRIRRRGLLTLLSILIFLPTGLGAAALQKRFPGLPDWIALMPAFAVMATYAVSGLVFARSTCPRCGNRFFKKGWSYNQLATKCRHCGLRLWGTPHPPHPPGG